MSSTIFFISTLLIISLVYYFVLKIFFDKSKRLFERWFNFLLINALTIVVNNYAFKGLSEIDKNAYSIGYPIGVTVLMYLVRGIYEFIFTPSNSFTSTEEKTSEIKVFPVREYKKVAESDADRIAIYPRITIRDIELETEWHNPKHIIFDSSDFVVINKTFGTFEGLQESFSPGKEFKFNDEKLYADKVQVDFMSVYDDYSGGLIKNHTDAYEGKDTPYHLQIIVWAKRILKD
jgi:hypothetical protein